MGLTELGGSMALLAALLTALGVLFTLVIVTFETYSSYLDRCMDAADTVAEVVEGSNGKTWTTREGAVATPTFVALAVAPIAILGAAIWLLGVVL